MDDRNVNEERSHGTGKPPDRALAAAGIQQLDDLARFRTAEIAALHGMGPKAMRQINKAMADKGLAFAAEPAGDAG